MSCFDEKIVRKNTNCAKWDRQGGDYLPMWVADMDFRSPKPMLDAVAKRLEHGVFGYQLIPEELTQAVVNHYKKLYDCTLDPEWLVWIPSVMPGANLACRLAGGDIIYNIPMYSHIRRLPGEVRAGVIEVVMKVVDGKYYMDFDALEEALTPDVKSFILCNPHNPVGRVFTPDEINAVVAFCKKHDLMLISDEIHCELILEGKHTPLFSLGGDAMKNSVTLTSAGKICNIPALPFGFAIIPDEKLRADYRDICKGLFSSPNALAVTALISAYNGLCDGWKGELINYLRNNRDYMEKRIAGIKGLSVVHNEGTYLAWVDCRETGIENPWNFFREKAGVNFNSCTEYGIADGFVRLNFGCPRAQLEECLDRVEESLEPVTGK